MTAPQNRVVQTAFEFGLDEVMRTLEELQREEEALREVGRAWEETDRDLTELDASTKSAWEAQLRLYLEDVA